jgi:hypothetical protein
MNQVLDNLEARALGLPIIALYGRARPVGAVMESLGIPENPALLYRDVLRVLAVGRTPKLKLGEDPDRDADLLVAIEIMARKFGFQYALDFNAGYCPQQWEQFLECVCRRILPRNAIIWEQPVREEDGVIALQRVAEAIQEIGTRSHVIADESFVTLNDALACAHAGIGLNFKLQKIGGLLIAHDIEAAVRQQLGSCPPSLVGGTFPTAIGRAYDRAAALSLHSIQLPSDGLLPAQAYFKREMDLAPLPTDHGKQRREATWWDK